GQIVVRLGERGVRGDRSGEVLARALGVPFAVERGERADEVRVGLRRVERERRVRGRRGGGRAPAARAQLGERERGPGPGGARDARGDGGERLRGRGRIAPQQVAPAQQLLLGVDVER